jgi:hypothetical protein
MVPESQPGQLTPASAPLKNHFLINSRPAQFDRGTIAAVVLGS